MSYSLSYFCGISASVFIALGLAMAMVRWFHMCRPYDRNPNYYYPGRPFVFWVCLGVLSLIPYVLHPDSPDAWFLARLYCFPMTLYNFTLLLYAYFGGVMQWKKWHWPVIVVGFPVVVSLLAAVVLALVPGDQITRISVGILYVMGVVMSAVCVAAMWMVLRWARQFDEDEFSNPADFPVVFARRWTVMIVVNMALCWSGALANNQAFLAVLMLLFASCMVLFIITALHPHRNRAVEEPEPESAPGRKASSAKILSVVNTVIIKQEAFLDPHLTIQDVADRSGYSRSYIAGLFKSEFGGFFPYINSLRLQHVDAYMQQHPAAPLQEALEASGLNLHPSHFHSGETLVKLRVEKHFLNFELLEIVFIQCVAKEPLHLSSHL